jgi:penicillin-insensitive murein DD-endopeptidase
VHSQVADIILASYAELANTVPSMVWVYGETGFPEGGRFKPHRTHQNGLSADFFVPVRTIQGAPAVLPSTIKNRFGYLIEFDRKGRYGNFQIDFAAYAEHLYQLHQAAKARGVGISLAIVEPAFLPQLFATSRGGYLRQNIPFMTGRPWVRHDEHFHIDFAIPCRPL